MEIRFLEIAQLELDEAVEYYNSESPGLGEEFLLSHSLVSFVGISINKNILDL